MNECSQIKKEYEDKIFLKNAENSNSNNLDGKKLYGIKKLINFVKGQGLNEFGSVEEKKPDSSSSTQSLSSSSS
jgi:hypothetical protein